MSRTKRHQRYFIGFVVLGTLLCLLFVCNVCLGSVNVWNESLDSIVANDIIMKLRLPRALAALILGGALALAGYLLQTFFHNPIAGPFVLGISSGAKLVVSIVMVFSLQFVPAISSQMLIIAAFVGAFISMGFVLVLSNHMRGQGMLIVAGVMIGYICSAITDLIVTFAQDQDIVNLHNWSKGSFSGITWDNVKVMTVVVFITFIITFLMEKPISAYLLGEDYAANMGVNIKGFRAVLVILSSLLSACVTAFAGPVSFVGIATPQLAQWIFKTNKPIVLIPASFLGGGVFCLGCDLIARTLFAPTELSISTVTAIFGAPVVVAVMIKRKRGD